ncbi:MAG: HAD family phosphatase [Candidatus Kryptoniota bacterium]
MENEKTPTTLFVDIGGVLLTNGWDRNARLRASELFNLEFEEMNERHHLTYDTYESGKISLKEYLDRIVFYEQRKFSHEDFRVFMFEQSKSFPQMIGLVKSLKEKYRLKVCAISNEGRELNDYRIRNFGLKDFIDFFIASSFVHLRKPDRDIYQIALEVAQASPENCVYIDDRKMFVEVAKGFGLRTIHHTDFVTTKAMLEQLGLGI